VYLFPGIRIAAACQTYEGGFGGEPNVGEAHGGYAYCALATLHLLDKTDMIADKCALRGWLARRQLSFEGGFSGRANKLVDGCYSFWQGACMALLNIQSSERSTHEEKVEPYLRHGIARSVEEDFLTAEGEEKSCEQPLLEQNRDEGFQLLFDQYKLQRYILLCAQEPSGGLRGVSLMNIEFSSCLVFSFPSYFVVFSFRFSFNVLFYRLPCTDLFCVQLPKTSRPNHVIFITRVTTCQGCPFPSMFSRL